MAVEGVWKIMEIFNLLSGVCSILGLLVSLFVATKVLKILNSNNNNKGELNCGEGSQKIAKEKAAFAENHSNATYYDYSNAVIQGEIDEPPVLAESYYPIFSEEFDQYSSGIAKKTCRLVAPKHTNTLCFITDFKNVISNPEINKWIGYCIKSLPMRDWRSFINDEYTMEFSYMSAGTINEVWVEITNKRDNKKLFKEKLELIEKEMRFVLQFSKYKETLNDWKSVDEICFVFFPEDCIGTEGQVFISGMSIRKN